jgi:hypothetical protein
MDQPTIATSGIILYGLADPMFRIASKPVLMSVCLMKVEGSQFNTYMALINHCVVIRVYFSGEPYRSPKHLLLDYSLALL